MNWLVGSNVFHGFNPIDMFICTSLALKMYVLWPMFARWVEAASFFFSTFFPNHLTWWSCIPESNYQWLSNQRAYDFLRESLSPTVVKGICRLAHLLVPLNIGLSLQVLHTNPAGLISFCGSQPFLHRGVPAGQKHHGTSRPRQPPCRRGTPQRGPTALYLDESVFGCGILWPFCGNQKEYKDW